jgi:hypothetical protein
MADNAEHVSTLHGMLRYYTGKRDQDAIFAAIRALSPAAAGDPAPDRLAIRLLVAAGFVTEEKANEALQIAYGFEPGPMQPQGVVGDGWTKDAEQWGDALNEAAWEFIDKCPEKSVLLFNTAKGALRDAILKYAAALHPPGRVSDV